MNFIKEKDVFMRFICIITIFSILIFWLYSDGCNEPIKYKQKIVERIIVPQTLNTAMNGPSYNYNGVINLIEEHRKLKSLFYSDYEEFVKNKSNFEKLKLILNELEREREYFLKYLQRVRTHNKRFSPNKRNTSLRYYYRIIDDSVDDVVEMIEKFRLRTKLKLDLLEDLNIEFIKESRIS